LGVFDTYQKGTYVVAKVMGDCTQTKGMLSIIGGGDSALAAEQSGHASRMSHISTGSGASLELLEGKESPGIQVLDNAKT
jgi:phosphoglycerate kinase